MCALYVHDPAPVCVEGCLAPGASGTAPTDLSVPRTSVESEPITPQCDPHLPLLAETVRREAIHAGTDQRCKGKYC